MVRQVIGAAILVASMGVAGPVGAQGFSGSGAAGVAQSQGLTASSGGQSMPADRYPATGGRELRALYQDTRRSDTDVIPRLGQTDIDDLRAWHR